MTPTMATVGGSVTRSAQREEASVRKASVAIELLVPRMVDGASFRPDVGGTTTPTGDVHGIPGGTEFYALRREVRDALWDYSERVHDWAGLASDVYSNAFYANARTLWSHAETVALALDSDAGEPRACGIETHLHPSIGAHLACLAYRLRRYVEPLPPREFTGPCPASADEAADSGPICGEDFHADAVRGGQCTAGHVLDAEMVRLVNLREARAKPLTLREAAGLSLRLAPEPITLESLRLRVKRSRLASTRGADGEHLVTWPAVAAAYGLDLAE